jgi:hypothetical protein
VNGQDEAVHFGGRVHDSPVGGVPSDRSLRVRAGFRRSPKCHTRSETSRVHLGDGVGATQILMLAMADEPVL